MQQYANGIDLLVSVCFISPGFSSLSLSLCHAVAFSSPLSYFSLLATSAHTDELGELIYSRTIRGPPCVPDVCAVLISSR